MAKIIGKNADWAIGDVNATPGFAYLNASAGMQRVETLANDITLNVDQNTDESTAYSDDFKTHEIIDAQWSVDMTLYYSTGTDEVDTLFVAAIIAPPFVKKGVVFSSAR